MQSSWNVDPAEITTGNRQVVYAGRVYYYYSIRSIRKTPDAVLITGY